jgi:hypothetical protein
MSIIKRSINIIAELLAHIINLSITSGIVPDKMKIACVIPLFKAGDCAISLYFQTTDQFLYSLVSQTFLSGLYIIVYCLI